MAALLESKLLNDHDVRTSGYVNKYIDGKRGKTVTASDIDTNLLPNFKSKHTGKVRDVYVCEDFVVMVATDRQSAFDRQLASVPFKGQVLNLTSNWWFQETKDIVPNHIIANPHPNVTIARRCTVFPVEFVMRGYMTGSTSTSMWTNYAKGVRYYCGHKLPDDLVKNVRLEKNLLTPTTKDDVHDELISAEEIVESGRMSQDDWETCSRYAHALFAYGQQRAKERGLILVDTKYEFGKDESGTIRLIDEIQTPDSSRYWIADTYEARMAAGQEPDNVDKEFLRKWYTQHCDPYKDAVLPDAPSDLVNELSRRYIMLFEVITGNVFPFTDNDVDINQALGEYFK